MVGALFMIVWSMTASLLSGRSIWTIPNIYATTFYGSDAYANQFLRSSWSGLALMMTLCGILGALWGVLARNRDRRFLTLTGAATGLLVYLLFFHLIWRHTNPLIPLYAPERQMQIGFILWGMALARSPVYSRRIALADRR
jgi:hypothetical protein